jgi:hypothetical protein
LSGSLFVEPNHVRSGGVCVLCLLRPAQESRSDVPALTAVSDDSNGLLVVTRQLPKLPNDTLTGRGERMRASVCSNALFASRHAASPGVPGSCVTTGCPDLDCFSRSRRQNSLMSYPAAANSSSRTRRTSDTMGSCQAVGCLPSLVIAPSHEFIRCAKDGRGISVLSAHLLDARAQFSIRDMSRVPRHEEPDAVVRGRSDVRSICAGPRRQGNPLDQSGGKVGDFGRDVQDRDASGERRAALVQDDLRDAKLKRWPTLPPPCVCHLLAGRHDQVAARAGREIADDARLDVDAGAHPLILPPGAFTVPGLCSRGDSRLANVTLTGRGRGNASQRSGRTCC